VDIAQDFAILRDLALDIAECEVIGVAIRADVSLDVVGREVVLATGEVSQIVLAAGEISLRRTSPLLAVRVMPAPRPAAVTSPLAAFTVTRAVLGTVTVRFTRPRLLPSDFTSTALPFTVTCPASESKTFLASSSELE
jgi:hypothetical protein